MLAFPKVEGKEDDKGAEIRIEAGCTGRALREKETWPSRDDFARVSLHLPNISCFMHTCEYACMV